MRYLKQLLSFFVVSFVASSLATAAATEAKVVKVTGDARVQLPGQTSSVVVTEGMALPQGATITTGNGEVWLSSFPGATAAIRHNSSVRVGELGTTEDGKRKALLELSRGRVTSTLDPTKSGITNYSIRTPKGVAAARGTVLDVSFEQSATTGEGEMTVGALSGTVTVTLINSSGNTVTLSLPVGNVVTSGGGAAMTAGGNPVTVTVAEAVAAGTISEQDLKDIVQFVATAVTASDTGYSNQAAQTLVRTVVASAVTAVGANSDAANSYIATAQTAVGSNSALSDAVTSGSRDAGQATPPPTTTPGGSSNTPQTPIIDPNNSVDPGQIKTSPSGG